MAEICFQNRKFKIREIKLPEIGSVLISTTSLNELLLNKNQNYVSNEANKIDESIYFFVDDNEIELSDIELLDLITKEVK
ncbi:hypothetical protein [Flavobacterium tyrosinilyticum]|uniref:hypothetical protein n=1 Tax=Flavobacterium tyrosinilyticum TaxID=1658740 RepID=UPI00202DF16D|nr:hypothetical protein [Flavobacterium tyrosinilyticum]MCM0665126.1 hypothetical protein [Flavobacterium tyrosinilyticum]